MNGFTCAVHNSFTSQSEAQEWYEQDTVGDDDDVAPANNMPDLEVVADHEKGEPIPANIFRYPAGYTNAEDLRE
jgi:hypothetical protein